MHKQQQQQQRRQSKLLSKKDEEENAKFLGFFSNNNNNDNNNDKQNDKTKKTESSPRFGGLFSGNDDKKTEKDTTKEGKNNQRFGGFFSNNKDDDRPKKEQKDTSDTKETGGIFRAITKRFSSPKDEDEESSSSSATGKRNNKKQKNPAKASSTLESKKKEERLNQKKTKKDSNSNNIKSKSSSSSSSSSKESSTRSVVQKFVTNLFGGSDKDTNKEEWVFVCSKTRLAPGQIVPVTAAGLDLLIVASKDGRKLHCIPNSCPHLGTPLETGALERRPIEPTKSSTKSPKSSPGLIQPKQQPQIFKESDVTAMLSDDGCEDCIVCPLHNTAFALDSGDVRGEWCPEPPVIGKIMGSVKSPTPLSKFGVRTRGKNVEVCINTIIEHTE